MAANINIAKQATDASVPNSAPSTFDAEHLSNYANSLGSAPPARLTPTDYALPVMPISGSGDQSTGSGWLNGAGGVAVKGAASVIGALRGGEEAGQVAVESTRAADQAGADLTPALTAPPATPEVPSEALTEVPNTASPGTVTQPTGTAPGVDSGTAADSRYALEHPFGPTGAYAGADPNSLEGKYFGFLKSMREGTATEDSIRPLASDPDEFIRRTVASNGGTPGEILTQLGSDSSAKVRIAVAQNPSTPAKILDQLASDSADVRKGVALNTSASPELLSRLASDPDENVRFAVAINKSTSPEVYRTLSTDPSYTVKVGVARSPHASDETLATLANDPNPFLRFQANSLQASRRTTPGDVLDALSQDPEHYELNTRVAQNASAPPAVLDRLANDPLLQISVLHNPSTSTATLKRLAGSEDKFIGAEAAKRLAAGSASA